jgi:hypothetical protein
MGFTGATSHPPDPSQKKPLATGLSALVLLAVNAAVFVGSYLASGIGVDSGIGLAHVFIFFTFPALLFTIVLGVLAIIRKKGRLPGAIALTVAGGAVLLSVYGFVSTQIL